MTIKNVYRAFSATRLRDPGGLGFACSKAFAASEAWKIGAVSRLAKRPPILVQCVLPYNVGPPLGAT